MSIIITRTLIIYVTIVFAMRFMGKRQLGELTPHELVITILISSIATIPLQSNTIPLATSIMPIAVLVSLEIIQSAIAMKSNKFRRIIKGRPIFVIRNGTIKYSSLKKLRLSLDDIIDSMRQQGVFDITEVENAIIETNGGLSIQLKSEFQAPTKKELKIEAKKASIPITIILDGVVIKDSFIDEPFSDSEIELLVKANNQEVKEIFYFNIDDNGATTLIKKDDII